MRLQEFIDLLVDGIGGNDPDDMPICIVGLDSGEVMYSDLIGNIPTDLLQSELGGISIPTDSDLVLTVTVEDIPYDESDNGMYSSTRVRGNYIRASKYDLDGQDGNAFALMGYTARALRNEGLGNLIGEMQEKATAGDYNNLICVCYEYVEMANEEAEKNGYVDDDYDDEGYW